MGNMEEWPTLRPGTVPETSWPESWFTHDETVTKCDFHSAFSCAGGWLRSGDNVRSVANSQPEKRS